MTPSQIKSLQRLTTKLDSDNRLTGFSPLNGTFTFRIIRLDDGRIQLAASNTEGLRWFETHVLLIYVIGIRGGVRLITEHRD